jgi:hypothetical protein
VAQLSQQLRRFLDDQAWLENRRIMDILHSIECNALALRDTPPSGTVMEVDDDSANIELTLERPLFKPAMKPLIASLGLQTADEEIDPSALFHQVVIDKVRLANHIRHALQDRAQVTLFELIDTQPLQQGLAELLAYLQLGTEAFQTLVDEKSAEAIQWQSLTANGEPITRSARLPRVIFTR